MRIHKTLVASSSKELDELITAELNSGWEYAGGVTVTVITSVSVGASEIRKDIQANVAGFTYQLIWAQGLVMEIME